MTLDEAIEAEIRRLYFAEHWCRGTIVAQLHVHPDAVERVLGRPGPKPRTAITLIPSALQPYAGFIEETLDRYPRLVGTRVCDMLRERGYTASLRTLRRYLRRVRPMPKQEVFLRSEPLVGEVQPSLTPTKPFDTITAPSTVFHGRDTATAEARLFWEATSSVRPPTVEVLETSPAPELSTAGLCSR